VAWGASGWASCRSSVLTLDYGRLPWIAAGARGPSFGTYGLVKKIAQVGLRGEHDHRDPGCCCWPALGYLLYWSSRERATFGGTGPATRCSWSERV